MPHRTCVHRKYLCMGASITKFAVAVMNWTRPTPVVEFGNDITSSEFAVGNDSPSMQPCMSLKRGSETPPTFAAMTKTHAII